MYAESQLRRVALGATGFTYSARQALRWTAVLTTRIENGIATVSICWKSSRERYSDQQWEHCRKAMLVTQPTAVVKARPRSTRQPALDRCASNSRFANARPAATGCVQPIRPMSTFGVKSMAAFGRRERQQGVAMRPSSEGRYAAISGHRWRPMQMQTDARHA
jgi:hypothetical protein